ncbi:MAG: hypothetical protein GDA50_05845 [Alphaproteobacteria bacterium GM202ARS2]|nr:hypothetical protein [Alphaproteobacteria bacterium GM202ARS2]
MTYLEEGNLRIAKGGALRCYKFDDERQTARGMKAVDFIFEFDDCYWFIEFKDPDDPRARKESRDKFFGKEIDIELAIKFRDTFLYRWAEGGDEAQGKKAIRYLVLFTGLDSGQRIRRMESLRNKLRDSDCCPKSWKNILLDECAIFDMEEWNKRFPDNPVSRLSESV